MPGFKISPEHIAEAETELARLDKSIDEDTRRRNALRDYVRAARALYPEGAPETSSPPLPEKRGSLFPTDEPDEQPDVANLQGMVEQIANDSLQPISKATMKIKLKQAGIAQKRVHGSYFYVAIERLKKRGRISVLPDGTLWKAQSQHQPNQGAGGESLAGDRAAPLEAAS
jgi:hypothetical protein